jgi:Arc/MetJ family transcription regulator
MMRYAFAMRTTVNLDDDVAAAIADLRARRGIGLSEAVNELVRAGLTVPTQRKPFVQKTANLGVMIDVSNVAEAIEIAEGPDWR